MPPRHCCCTCIIQEDDFNRDDGPISGDWLGDGELLDGVLIADNDHTLICHPASKPLGSLYATVLLKDCDPANTYTIRVGDPNGAYEVEVTFTGTAGAGDMIITVKNGVDPDESYTYPWVNADEPLTVCYAPELWISARGANVVSNTPIWVTICIPKEPSDNCWVVDGTDVGNWTFVQGKFDDFVMEIHWLEQRSCQNCDCYCHQIVAGEDVFKCIPKILYLTITSDDCINGTYQMLQYLYVTNSPNDPPTIVASTSKQQWISDEIDCPVSTSYHLKFVLTCNNDPSFGYPKMDLHLIRYGESASADCNSFQFDIDDPDTQDTSLSGVSLESFAWSKSISTCSPFYLKFPAICEGEWSCSDPDQSCCGGYIQSGDPPPPPIPPFCMDVELSE